MRVKLKGQFTVEFIIAVVSFILLVVYVMNFVNNELPPFTSQHNSDIIKVRALQISELLIFDDGVWDSNPLNPPRIGLASGYRTLNRTKTSYLNTLCSTEAGYGKILSNLNINTHLQTNSYVDFKNYLISENRCADISIYDSSSKLLSCPPAGSDNWECVNIKTSATQRYQIVRYAPDTDGRIINMTVGVW
ncbi:MAG: hypothetical protein HY515_04740 [Candidatus Aenigmarchaeota archaeon]|nr:hypothetical protein [Candidatus Aenigmarchaeota archaeon]